MHINSSRTTCGSQELTLGSDPGNGICDAIQDDAHLRLLVVAANVELVGHVVTVEQEASETDLKPSMRGNVKEMGREQRERGFAGKARKTNRCSYFTDDCIRSLRVAPL